MSTILGLMNNPAPDDFSDKKKVMKHSIVEFIATAIFVYMGTISAVSTGTKLGGGGGDGGDVARIWPIAFAFGISIMCLVYSIGHITGGHMNPAVSLLMYFERQMSIYKMLCYWLAQFLGAWVGSAFVWASVKNDTFVNNFGNPPFLLGSNTIDSQINSGNAFLLEMAGSFFFFFVISQTALDKKGIASSNFFAIPIGFSLVVVHICLIPFTGCGVNPARTFGPAINVCASGLGKEVCDEVITGAWWVYWIGPFVAAFLVAEITDIVAWAETEDPKVNEEKAAEDA